MDSPHTLHRIVGGGAVFERGGAAVGKTAFAAAMIRGMVAVEASIGASVCLRSEI